MNDRPKHTLFAASLFAVVAFLLGIVLAEMAIGMGNACWEYAHPIEGTYTGQRLEPFETLLHGSCVALGLVCGVFVFRVCRRSAAPSTVFHVPFVTGLALLCFCLWLVLISFPILDSSLAMDWSTHILTPLFSAPLTSLILIPVAVLLLSYATSRGDNHNS